MILALLTFIIVYSIKNAPTQEDYDRAAYESVERHKARKEQNG